MLDYCRSVLEESLEGPSILLSIVYINPVPYMHRRIYSTLISKPLKFDLDLYKHSTFPADKDIVLCQDGLLLHWKRFRLKNGNTVKSVFISLSKKTKNRFPRLIIA